MGASFTPSQKSKGRRTLRPMAEINVTPMVDVMLVLLVIFMVAAPMMHTGVGVDLPTSSGPSLPQKDTPVTLTLTQAGDILVDEGEPVSLAQLADVLTRKAQGRQDIQVHLKADKKLSYGQVMETMNVLQQGGYTKIALVSVAPPTAASVKAASVTGGSVTPPHPSGKVSPP